MRERRTGLRWPGVDWTQLDLTQLGWTQLRTTRLRRPHVRRGLEWCWRLGQLALCVWLGVPCGWAQAPPAVAQSTEEALHAMAQQAGVIFAGRVTGVQRHPGADGATGVVEITFAVEDAVRGVSGPSYTVREWAGLWAAGDAPLRVGQRYLMLLHAPGAAGLSSPVDGPDGAIPVRGGAGAAGSAGAPLASGGAVADLAADLSDLSVDLRWVATRVVRSATYGLTARPVLAHGEVVPTPAGAPNGVPAGELADVLSPPATASSSAESAAVEAGQAAESYSAVIGILRGWEKVDYAAR